MPVLAEVPGPYVYPAGELLLIYGVYFAPILLALIFGLIVGSFINVVVWRSPRWRSLMDPPSHCYSCGTLIEPRYNIPVFTYLRLGGKCAYCRAPFSSRYMWIELLTGLLFAGVLFAKFYLPDMPLTQVPNLHLGAGVMPYLAKAYVFVTLLLIIAAIDAEFRYIFHTFTIPGILLGLASAGITFADPSCVEGWSTGQYYLDSLYGALLGLGVIGLFYAIFPKGMGAGDVMLAGMLGAFLGWRGLAMGLYASILTGGAAALIVMIGSIAKGTYKPGTLYIPFGPFLAIGALLGMLFGCQWFDDYVNSFTSSGDPASESASEQAGTVGHE